jgi:hypothetical protein
MEGRRGYVHVGRTAAGSREVMARGNLCYTDFMANFKGFDEAQVQILTADLESARQISTRCASFPAAAAILFREAFAIDSTDEEHAGPIRAVYSGFAARMATANLEFHPGIGDAAALEFDSFPDRTRPNTILVRPSYFFKAPVDRALTLVHHYVHLRFPRNPGDGHPGGMVAMFARGSMRITPEDACRNPYCYEYFARFLPLV